MKKLHIGDKVALVANSNGLYKENKGTSFSSPFVSGALALLKNWFRDKFKREPSQDELYALINEEQSSIKEEYNVNQVYPPKGFSILSLYSSAINR